MESNSRARCAQEMQHVGSSLLIRLTGRTEHIHIFYSYANQNKLKIGQKYTEVNEISNQIILCVNMLARTNKWQNAFIYSKNTYSIGLCQV